jgi:orotidine-5'-phosphate decarboxylase
LISNVKGVKSEERIIVALDVGDMGSAEALVRDLKGLISYFKVGLELFTSSGPDVARMVTGHGARLFLDLKFFDIPNTVRGAVKSISSLGASMINVHAMGGGRMMRAAAEAAAESPNRPKVIAVTVLTSFEEEEFSEVGFSNSIGNSVVNLAAQAKEAGLDGVVCSPQEIRPVRDRMGTDFLIVTPGVRPAWSSADDQRRVMTPKEAFNAGADFIVIGRPITADKDPAGAAQRIIEELGG